MGKQGKGARARSKKRRDDQKRAKKRAQRALWQARAAAGENTKSFRYRKKSKRKPGMGDKGKHLIADCGNVGCLRCNPEERKPKIVLSKTETVKFLNKTFPLELPKKQIHPGRNPAKNRRRMR